MITFVTCWYELKAKFNKDVYRKWFSGFLSNVNKFKLIIFSDQKSSILLEPYIRENDNIRLIIKPIEKFYNYKYKHFWIKNHEKNNLLNKKISWKLNMLWSEKINFVKEAILLKIFDNELFGWCDIGYFRGRFNDIPTSLIREWPNSNKLHALDNNKIHYGNVCNNKTLNNHLFRIVNTKNNIGLPIQPIPNNQTSFAGGFFIINKNLIDWWFNTYDNKLKLYFKNDYLVKDDQIIIVDCIYSNLKKFNIHFEKNSQYDNWFMFQRILL